MHRDVTDGTFKAIFDDVTTSYEFDVASQSRYRAVEVMAVLSVVFGIFSLATAYGWLFIGIPIAGIVLAVLALRKIADAPEARTGSRVAKVGLVVCIVNALIGLAGWMYVQTREVPFGYQPISFTDLELTIGKPIPKSVNDLADKRVYIKGFMYPGRQTIGLKEFLLVPTMRHCKFCSTNIPPTQIIRVELVGDLKTDFASYMIGVGGRLRIDKDVVAGKKRGLPYKIEADYIR